MIALGIVEAPISTIASALRTAFAIHQPRSGVARPMADTPRFNASANQGTGPVELIKPQLRSWVTKMTVAAIKLQATSSATDRSETDLRYRRITTVVAVEEGEAKCIHVLSVVVAWMSEATSRELRFSGRRAPGFATLTRATLAVGNLSRRLAVRRRDRQSPLLQHLSRTLAHATMPPQVRYNSQSSRDSRAVLE